MSFSLATSQERGKSALLGEVGGRIESDEELTWYSTVVATLDKNSVETLLLTAPPYVLAVITTFLNSWHAGMEHL